MTCRFPARTADARERHLRRRSGWSPWLPSSDSPAGSRFHDVAPETQATLGFHLLRNGVETWLGRTGANGKFIVLFASFIQLTIHRRSNNGWTWQVVEPLEARSVALLAELQEGLSCGLRALAAGLRRGLRIVCGLVCGMVDGLVSRD